MPERLRRARSGLLRRSNYLVVGNARLTQSASAGRILGARWDCELRPQGRLAASGPAAGEKGLDDALFLGFYLVRAVELIVVARGFSRCTRHKDVPRLACAFNA